MLKIVEFVEYDLRKLTWNIDTLREVQREYKLKETHAVLYVNTAHDRFRLVTVLNGMPVLVIPPIDYEERISLYLKVSQFLRKFSFAGTLAEHLDAEIEHARNRVDKAKRRKENVKYY